MGFLIEIGIYALIFFSPFAFGAVEFWARGIFQIVAGAVILVWAVRRLGGSAPAGARRNAGGPAMITLWTCIALFMGLVAVQLLPVPAPVLGVVSPSTHALYSRTIPGYAQGEPFATAALVPWLLQGEASPLAAPPLAAVDLRTSFQAARPLSIYPHGTMRELMLLACLIGLFAVTADHFRSRERMTRLVIALGISGFVVSLFGIIQKLTWNGKLYWVREGSYNMVFGPFVNRNSYAAFAGTIFPLALCLSLAASRRLGRGDRNAMPTLAFWGFAMVVSAGGILMSLSRGGMVSAALSVAIVGGFLVYYGARRMEIALLIGLLVLCAGLLIWLGPEMVIERAGTLADGDRTPSMVYRVRAWSHALGLFSDHFLLGTGLGTFPYAFLAYSPPGEAWWTTAHNEYLELLCDTGAMGGALALTGFLASLRRTARPSVFKGRPQRYLYAGLVSGLAALLAHSAISSNLQVPANGLLLALAGGALMALVAHQEAAPPARTAAPSPRWARRSLIGLVSLAFVANAVSGVRQIGGFVQRRDGEKALARGDLDAAYDSLRSAVRWEPAESSGQILLGRVVELGMSTDGAPHALQGRDADEMLGAGLAAVAGGIAANPADTWGWFNIAHLYEGHRALRVKRTEIARATRQAIEQGSGSGPSTDAGSGVLSADTLEGALEALKAETGATGAVEENAQRLIQESLAQVRAGGQVKYEGIPPGTAIPPEEEPATQDDGRLDPEDVVAIRAARKALELKPESHSLRDFLAGVYWSRGLRDEGQLLVKESLSREPSLSEHGFLKREEMVADLAGPLLEGLTQAQQNRFADPEVALRSRAEILNRLGRDQEALEAYEELRSSLKGRHQAEVDIMVGELLQRGGDYRASLAPLKRAADGVDGYAYYALFKLGIAHARLGEHKEAVAALSEHLRRSPESLWAYIELAAEKEQLGEIKDAQRLLQGAVRRFPRHPEAYRRLVDLLTREGKEEEALRYAEALMKIESSAAGRPGAVP